MSTRDIVAELPALVASITDGTLRVQTRAVPLAQVEQAWRDSDDRGRRVVVTPQR